MKIFSVEGDIDNFQIILPVSDSDEIIDILDFDGLPKLDTWKQVQFYIDNPLKIKSEFFFFISCSAFASTQLAVNTFKRFWNICAELLPIYLEDNTQLFIVNVIDCVNTLDKENSKFDYYLNGEKSNRILEYSFHKSRLHESSIFKIPETAPIQILTYSRYGDPDAEFITAYHNSGFKGLDFNLLYEEND